MATLGIDFGTSNTAAAYLTGGRPRLVQVEPGQTTLPTSVFFHYDAQAPLFGSAANQALIAGQEGRFMRALKSVLGTSLMHERRQIGYERQTLVEVVAKFLKTVKDRAEAETGQTFHDALSGRPVRFHSTDASRNARAENDLRKAYQIAGFQDVRFLFEPAAAALTAGPLPAGGLGLIVDIGGGTSDFSVFSRDGNTTNVIANHGVRIGGTDFDKALSIAHVMPLLGHKGLVRNELGSGTTTVPNALFHDLATWEKIAFVYTPETARLVKMFCRQGVEPRGFERLASVIEMETGHDIAFAVEAGKIAANSADAAIDLAIVEPGLSPALTTMALQADLAGFAQEIGACAKETLALAGVSQERISQIVFVGGSSLMRIVGQTLSGLFPDATQERASAFTAVAEGLARATV